MELDLSFLASLVYSTWRFFEAAEKNVETF